jgi:hypothetical protein
VKSIYLLVIVLAIALVALIGSHFVPTRTPQTSPISVHSDVSTQHAVPRSEVITALLPKRRANSLSTRSETIRSAHLISDAPGDVAKEVKAEAIAGSPDAMHELASALHECSRAQMLSDDEIERQVAKRSLGREILSGEGTTSSPGDDAARVKRLERVRDSCLQIPKAESDQWINWLEKSATAGDSQARVEFAWQALDEFPTQEAKEENAEEYVRRRDEAFGLLQDSIANGDCSNGIFNGFRKVSPDPLNEYVYEGLLLQHALDDLNDGRLPPNVVSIESQSVQAILNNLALGVPAAQRSLAQATTRDILQNYCTAF